MRVSFVIAAAGLAAFSAASPAANQSLVFGHSAAEDCFRYAMAERHDAGALEVCNAALQTERLDSGEYAGTLVNRGIVLMLGGSAVDANADYDKALSIDPYQAEAYLNKGINMFRTGDSATALNLANRARELRTTRPAIAYYVRGLANEDRGNIKAAYNDLVTAHNLAPTWSEPSEQLARYRVN